MDQNAVFADPPEGGVCNRHRHCFDVSPFHPETFILSPNHPYPYPLDYEQVGGDVSQLLKVLTLLLQTWLLQSTTGRNIDLSFPSLDLRSQHACTGDYLEADM